MLLKSNWLFKELYENLLEELIPATLKSMKNSSLALKEALEQSMSHLDLLLPVLLET